MFSTREPDLDNASVGTDVFIDVYLAARNVRAAFFISAGHHCSYRDLFNFGAEAVVERA